MYTWLRDVDSNMEKKLYEPCFRFREYPRCHLGLSFVGKFRWYPGDRFTNGTNCSHDRFSNSRCSASDYCNTSESAHRGAKTDKADATLFTLPSYVTLSELLNDGRLLFEAVFVRVDQPLTL